MTKKEDVALRIQESQIELQREQAKNFTKLIDKGLPALEKYLSSKVEKLDAPKFKWTLIIFSILLFVVVILTGALVYVGKVDGANFTFLLGILMGSVITFLGDVIVEVKP